MCQPLEERRRKGACPLSASTVQRWLDGAGRTVQPSLKGQLAGGASSGQMGTDGLWARLRGGAERVVLGVVDSVSGVMWPPVVASGEKSEENWRQLLERARIAGLQLPGLYGVSSDGSHELLAYLRRGLPWVSQQRCVWHLWRGLARELAAGQRSGAEAGRGSGQSVARASAAGAGSADPWGLGCEGLLAGRNRPRPIGGTSLRCRTGPGALGPTGRRLGSPLALQPWLATRRTRMVLARLPLAPQPRTQPRLAGPSTTISPPLNGGPNVDDTIATPAAALWQWPELPQETLTISMLWVYDCSQLCSTCPPGPGRWAAAAHALLSLDQHCLRITNTICNRV